MRKLFVTLLGIFLMGTAANIHAYTPHALATQIQRQTAQARRQDKQQQSHVQASNNKPETFFGLPVISYEDFKKYDQQERQRRARFAPLSNQIFSVGTQSKFGVLDYVTQTKNVRYIYIGELHFHSSIQEEIKRIITAVREANPNEKILLASEFFYRTHPLTNPLHLEGTENTLASIYPEFPKLADDLHMDTLALDDRIILFRDADKASFVKIGDCLIRAGNERIELHDSSSDNITAKAKKDPQSYVPLNSTILPTSAWGIKQRNLQWAQRIKEVEDQYKTIIIWAGMGHLLLDTGYPFALPFLISSPDAVEFEIFETEPPNTESETSGVNTTRGNDDKKRYTEITRNENSVSQELQEKILELLNEGDESVKIEGPIRLPHKRFDLHLDGE